MKLFHNSRLLEAFASRALKVSSIFHDLFQVPADCLGAQTSLHFEWYTFLLKSILTDLGDDHFVFEASLI